MKNKLGVKALCAALVVSILLSFKLPAFAVIGNDKEGTEKSFDDPKEQQRRKELLSDKEWKFITDVIYDEDYYKENNPDVVKVVGDSKKALLEHFKSFGLWEGRQANPDFNLNAYASAYKDLRLAFEGLSPEQMLLAFVKHYATFGEKENRELTTIEKVLSKDIPISYFGSFETETQKSGQVILEPKKEEPKSNITEIRNRLLEAAIYYRAALDAIEGALKAGSFPYTFVTLPSGSASEEEFAAFLTLYPDYATIRSNITDLPYEELEDALQNACTGFTNTVTSILSEIQGNPGDYGPIAEALMH